MNFISWQKLLFSYCLLLFAGSLFAQNKIYELDYKDVKAKDAIKWLKQRDEYGFQRNVEELNPSFEDGKLVFRPEVDEIGYLTLKVDIPDAKILKLYWGVSEFHETGNYDEGFFRETFSVTVSFGKETQPSGSFFIPDAPYFLNILYTNTAQPGKQYITNYYKKGGRSICPSCPNLPTGMKEAVTEVNLKEEFQKAFPGVKYRPISSFTFGSDVRDSDKKYTFFIRKIEVFD